jgi:hypothetical protein
VPVVWLAATCFLDASSSTGDRASGSSGVSSGATAATTSGTGDSASGSSGSSSVLGGCALPAVATSDGGDFRLQRRRLVFDSPGSDFHVNTSDQVNLECVQFYTVCVQVYLGIEIFFKKT